MVHFVRVTKYHGVSCFCKLMVYFYKLLKLIVLLVLVTLLQNGDLKHQGGGDPERLACGRG